MALAEEGAVRRDRAPDIRLSARSHPASAPLPDAYFSVTLGSPSGSVLEIDEDVDEAAVAPFAEMADLEAECRNLGLVGRHPAFVTALKTAAQLAPHAIPVIILGETGTGKELFARLIHALSSRRRMPFIAVNCASISGALAESHLFGHVRGAFTGAIADIKGYFEQADGGTLFLDEVGDLSPEVQPRLLRVLEDGIVQPLGSTKSRKVDVRIVAATNRPVAGNGENGGFRQDL